MEFNRDNGIVTLTLTDEEARVFFCISTVGVGVVKMGDVADNPPVALRAMQATENIINYTTRLRMNGHEPALKSLAKRMNERDIRDFVFEPLNDKEDE